jgi:anti-sigma factor ChrR (cupin superfamily)
MAAVGVGTADNARKNGLAVYADGRVRAGKGGTSGNDLVTVDQLNNTVDQINNTVGQLNNTHFPQTNKIISTSNSEGWYQIAKGSNIKPVSGIFKVTA